MKKFRSRAIGALDCLWQVGLLSGVAAFFVGAVAGVRQIGSGGYVPFVCIAAIAAYGIIFTRLDPVEHALVRIGFGPVSETGRGVLRLTALLQLFGLVLASGPAASAAGYGNFCLTLLLIGTFGGSLAVYYRDSTPD
ncbi:hypothetical protein HY633_05595 [Candidatus Uhrbacteria bacterium]|nr:hypothetical protein [Candidatus Uhrbacteria bacterium]